MLLTSNSPMGEARFSADLTGRLSFVAVGRLAPRPPDAGEDDDDDDAAPLALAPTRLPYATVERACLARVSGRGTGDASSSGACRVVALS